MQKIDATSPEAKVRSTDLMTEGIQEFEALRKGERSMLSEHTVLRRLPSINPKQTIFLDGIRHAIEFATLSYSRLLDDLQTLSRFLVLRETDSATSVDEVYVSAHLHAWAFIDSVDRFHMLLRQSGAKLGKDLTIDEFKGIAECVRKMRNIADHTHQRIDHLAATESPALGSLTWYAHLDPSSETRVICTTRPGTSMNFGDKKASRVTMRAHETTGMISLVDLFVGDVRICISDVADKMKKQVHKIEESVARTLEKMKLQNQYSQSDWLMGFVTNTTDPQKKDWVISRVHFHALTRNAVVHFLGFNRLFGISTVTKMLNGQAISASSFGQMFFEDNPEGGKRACISTDQTFLVFKGLSENEANRYAWKELAQMIMNDSAYTNAEQVAIISDYEAHNHKEYNGGRIPIYDGFRLPNNISLIHAEDATTRQIVEDIISECRQNAFDIIRQLENCSAIHIGDKIWMLDDIPTAK